MTFRFVCAFVVVAGNGVMAQTTRVPDIERGSVEVGWNVSRRPAPTAIPDPRFAEILTATDTFKGQTWYDLGARLYWTRALSTMVEVGATTWGLRQYRTRSPVLLGAFEHNTLQHRRALSIVQSVDIARKGRVVPWAGGGVVFHRTSSRECVISGGRGFAGCARRLAKDTAAVAASRSEQ